MPWKPPVHYHALIGEKGPGHARHREFVIFHGEFFYPSTCWQCSESARKARLWGRE